jgi:hypothetical protein
MPDPTDLMDTAGRLRRIVVAVAVGVAVGVVAYLIADRLVAPETETAAVHVTSRQMSGGAFVLWIAGIALAGGFAITLSVLEIIAKRRWRDAQVPRARALD